MPLEERKLQDLVSIGPAMLRDFELVGIASVNQLSRQNPEKLYEKLCRITKQPVDICCLDVFRAAVAQAQKSRFAGRAMPVVVLESQTEGTRWLALSSVR